MLRLISFLVILGFAAPATAQEQSIEDVITSQLQAFNDRDVEAAWQYASPMIKGIFGTPDNFGMMVRNGYPMVWDNEVARFLEAEQMPNGVRQEVLIRGADGVAYILDYSMIQTDAGWQINGVQVIPAPEMMS